MSDDRPTRPSRPSPSVPSVTPPPAPRPFALIPNTLSTLDRIVRRHVEESAELTIGSAPLVIVAARESDLVRLLVRLVADAALTLPVPRAPGASIAVSVQRDACDVSVVVDVAGPRRDACTARDDTQPTLEALAQSAGATIADDAEGRRIVASFPLAVPLDSSCLEEPS